MKQIMSRIGIASLVATFVVVSIGFSVQAAVKKKVSGTNKHGPVISRTEVSPGVVPKQHFVQQIRKDTVNSSDPDFSGEQVIYEQSDSVAGTGSHRGYLRVTYSDGDESYGKYEGTHKTTVKEGGAWGTTWEGTFQWTGGTGKFKNIKGSGTYTGKASPTVGATTNWEGEVEY